MTAPDTLSGRIQRVHAHGRVGEVLLGVALDLVAPYASDYLSADDYIELLDLLDHAVRRSANDALARLVVDVEESMAAADPRLAARVANLRRWHG